MHRTILLAAAAASALTFDLIVAGPVADAVDPTEALEKPLELPIAMLLTGEVQSEATVDGVLVRVEPDGDGFALHVENNTWGERHLALAVGTYETSGSMISRMPPLPELVHTEDVDLTLPPAGRAIHRLSWSPAVGPEPAEGLLGSFTTVEFVLEGDEPTRLRAPLAG